MPLQGVQAWHSGSLACSTRPYPQPEAQLPPWEGLRDPHPAPPEEFGAGLEVQQGSGEESLLRGLEGSPGPVEDTSPEVLHTAGIQVQVGKQGVRVQNAGHKEDRSLGAAAAEGILEEPAEEAEAVVEAAAEETLDPVQLETCSVVMTCQYN